MTPLGDSLFEGVVFLHPSLSPFSQRLFELLYTAEEKTDADPPEKPPNEEVGQKTYMVVCDGVFLPSPSCYFTFFSLSLSLF